MSSTATAAAPSFLNSSAMKPYNSLTPSRSASHAAAAAPLTPTATPSPGSFRHPRLTEIIQRQSASTLSERQIKTAATNGFALLISFVIGGLFRSTVTQALSAAGVSSAEAIASGALLAVRLILVANIVFLLRPVLPYVSKKDEITDIPLTPSQRALLGLNPSTPSTPTSATGQGFITPPRYRRSSGSFSGSPSSLQNTPAYAPGSGRSISANYASSPLSASSRNAVGYSPSPSNSMRRASGSPFSTPVASGALFRKATNYQSPSVAEADIDARSSFASSTGSGLGRSQSLRDLGRRRESFDLGTPSPRGVERERERIKVQPGVNYKWLYDKGRGLPKSDSYQGF